MSRMMLRYRATGRRLVADGTTLGRQRQYTGQNLWVLARHESINCRRSLSSMSSLQPIGTRTSHVICHDRNAPTIPFMVPACRFSAHPIIEFDTSDSETLSDSPELHSHPPSHDDTSKPRNKKKTQNTGKDGAIPKQSTAAARILFQSIAPHIELRTLHQLTKQLTIMIARGHRPQLDTLDGGGRKRTLKRRLGMLFEWDKEVISKGQYSWSVKSHLWIEPLVYQFLMGKFMENPESARHNAGDPHNKAKPLPESLEYQTNSTYPPNRNRQKFQRNLKTLIKAREMALEHRMFWTEQSMKDSGYIIKTGEQRDRRSWKQIKRSRRDNLLHRQQTHLVHSDQTLQVHAEKSESQLTAEGEHILEVLMHRLPQIHFEKMMNMFEKYAEVHGDTSAQKRESWYLDEDDSPKSKGKKGGKQQIKPLEEIAPKNLKEQRISVLGSTLMDYSASHSHLVAVELGQYFYVDMLIKGSGAKHPESTSESINDQQNTEETTTAIEPDTIRPSDALAAIRKHRKLSSSEKRYQKARDDFVKKMVQLQHEFASWEDDPSDNASGYSDEIGDDSGDDPSSDLMVKEFQKEQMNYTVDARRMQNDALAETLVELRKLGLRKDDDGSSIKKRGRPKKGTHLKFTAVKMDDDSTTPSELLTSESEMEQRIVFINNLPIDAKEEEIDQIYSRCGPLESVQLFNLRPDLDPGPLSKKQLEERKRKQRINNAPGADTYAMYQRQINQRPRSPVYGILKFQTAEGFNLATCSDMSLFGCVIRRHPVMSIKPRDMKTLYVENIPPNLYSIEVEYKLARLLHPHKVYVMLDGMKGVGGGCQEYNGVADEYQEYAEPSSCEVKFEDFRSANDAYNWMRGEGADGEPLTPSASFMGSDDCQVHWFRTPADATRYWTRELNF